MKYKIGDIVIYNEELKQHGSSSNKYRIKNILILNSLHIGRYYEVQCLDNDVSKVLVSPRVPCVILDANTELDKSYVRETKLNKLL